MSNKISDFQFLTSDFIIVGQGIAGTLLAHALMRAGKSVLVIDDHHRGASSQAAAGIMNPITGRRYVKSWRVDDLLPVAKPTYRELENLLGIKIFHPRRILRTMANAKEENDWLGRTAEPGYAPYIADATQLGTYAQKTQPAFGYGEVLRGGQVDLPLLIEHFRKYLAQSDAMLDQKFNFDELEILPEGVRYQNLTAEKIIFCEGANVKQNPFFNYLPLEGNKGQSLIVRIPGAGFEKILKQQVFIVPLAERDLYWIGSTYERQYADDQPTEQGLRYLHERLAQVLRVPFEVVEHMAAVRPTVADRRPMLGLHPEFSQLGIFNGLGTKGASLGPFWAKQLVDFLLHEEPLDEAVDIQRFESFFE